MFGPVMCGHGAAPLPGDSHLSLAGVDADHKVHCALCGVLPVGDIDPACYFAAFRRCFSHGFLPAVDPLSDRVPVPLYAGAAPDGSKSSLVAFEVFADKQISKLLDKGIIVPCGLQDHEGTVSSVGINVQGSRRTQMRVLTDIDARDDQSFEAALARLCSHDATLADWQSPSAGWYSTQRVSG